MKSRKKLTVTIGIPAYNEQENISCLLRSIIKQKAWSYRLQSVVVVCDGSTDGTLGKARIIA